jgi:predicted protein tyrosine phosphatase
MPMILVTSLSHMPDALRAYRPSHLVTLLSPEHMIETPPGFAPERHLRLGLNDIADPAMGEAPPAARHIAQLIAFGRAWNGGAPMLVHCWAGVSRSMAAAFTLLCDRNAAGEEMEIARAIRARASFAHPNRLLVRLADEALGREGRMIRAVEALGPGRFVEEGVPVELPLDLLHA